MTTHVPALIIGYGGSCAINLNSNDELNQTPKWQVIGTTTACDGESEDYEHFYIIDLTKNNFDQLPDSTPIYACSDGFNSWEQEENNDNLLDHKNPYSPEYANQYVTKGDVLQVCSQILVHSYRYKKTDRNCQILAETLIKRLDHLIFDEYVTDLKEWLDDHPEDFAELEKTSDYAEKLANQDRQAKVIDQQLHDCWQTTVKKYGQIIYDPFKFEFIRLVGFTLLYDQATIVAENVEYEINNWYDGNFKLWSEKMNDFMNHQDTLLLASLLVYDGHQSQIEKGHLKIGEISDYIDDYVLRDELLSIYEKFTDK